MLNPISYIRHSYQAWTYLVTSHSERYIRIELTSPAWQAGILTVVLIPHKTGFYEDPANLGTAITV